MDKVFSARVDESVIYLIDSLARRLGTTKKKLLENAVRDFASRVDRDFQTDIFTETCGIWKRQGPVEEQISDVRNEFARSMSRFAK